jgi:hypothetical protein
MKKIKFATLTAMLAVTTLFTSCDKDDDVIVDSNSSANLAAGRAGIVFNTNTNFAGSASFDERNTSTTVAISDIAADRREIELTALELTGGSVTDSRTASISLDIPATSSTTGGSLTSDLSIPGTETRIAHVTLTSVSGSTPGATFTSDQGTLTITKLTDTEIEGTFSGRVTEAGGSNTMLITNGTFAGKFQ